VVTRVCVCVCVFVCLCVCLSVRGRMPTLLHGPGCNLGEWWGIPLLVHYWADLQSVHGLRCYGNTRNAWQSPAVIHQAHRTPHALRMPAKTPLASNKIDAPAADARRYLQRGRSISSRGVVVTRTRNVSQYMLVLVEFCRWWLTVGLSRATI